MDSTERMLIGFIEDFGNFKQSNEEKLGKIFTELERVKVTGEKTHEQACKTNGKVLKLNEVTIPKIEEKIICVRDSSINYVDERLKEKTKANTSWAKWAIGTAMVSTIGVIGLIIKG